MYALRILQAHLSVLVRLVDTLGLTIEDDLLQFGGIHSVLVASHTAFVQQAVLEETLSAINHATRVSALLQFHEEPFDDFVKGLIVAA